jgi:regulator of sirC expression with transglutaminase-like and TPR domain
MTLGPSLRALLEHGDETTPLDQAAFDLARIEYPDLDPSYWLHRLDEHASAVHARSADGDGADFLQGLHSYLVEDLGFRGNREDYYNPRNSCLNFVLEERMGIPISLSLVYLEIGRRLNRDVRGISLPGHFLVEFRQGGFSVYLDAYHGGRFLTREDCLLVAAQAASVELSLNDPVFEGASKRQMMLRMLNNLRGIYLERRELEKALQVVDLLVAGDHSTGAWYKQRAAIRIDLGDWEQAAHDLERYLELAPFATDRAQVEHYVTRLKKT